MFPSLKEEEEIKVCPRIRSVEEKVKL